MSECYQPDWYIGVTCDHLYAECPNRKRSEAELRRVGWWFPKENPLSPGIDPHAGDVCGLCLHRHNRTHHRKSA